ncbi:hypothetical protein GGH12_000062 [Coemansia sp. RSA 1822]|nr:hypothetical protein IW147_000151 [Coemansia sp. RSA 720]KAJ2543950.1 hypothetical protein GGF49_001592 [Coemansia sp. RSA 1853]KAJ2567931.1 hypothetical protein GGH12_000062 [Coemansia sp. RSA 1822]
MKSVQFVAATAALVALVSAQNIDKDADAPAKLVPNSATDASASPKVAKDDKPKDDKPKGEKPKDNKAKDDKPQDDKTKAKSPVSGAPKPTTSPSKKFDAKNKNAKSAKDNISAVAPDSNAASHQLAASAALLGAAVIAGAYI